VTPALLGTALEAAQRAEWTHQGALADLRIAVGMYLRGEMPRELLAEYSAKADETRQVWDAATDAQRVRARGNRTSRGCEVTRWLMERWDAWARGEWTEVDLRDLNGWANRVYAGTRPVAERVRCPKCGTTYVPGERHGCAGTSLPKDLATVEKK
jgi:hypothetical protein